MGPAPFPKWSDSVLRLALSGAFAFVVGVPTLLMAWVRSPAQSGQFETVDQPIAFDHRHHVRDDGIDCRYCHYDVTRAPMAGVPDTALCLGCHGQIWVDSPMTEPVRRSFFTAEPIHWRRVTLLPDFVYFNHAIHVKKGVGCESCHGRVDLMANVSTQASFHMGWCLDCHRAPERHLRPPGRVTEMGYLPPEPQAVLGARLKRELHVDPPVYCSGCHR
jgi:hypothetical protein